MKKVNLSKECVFYGDNTGEYNTYLLHDGDNIAVSPSVGELLQYIRQNNSPEVNNDAVAYLLQSSVIPYPETAYKNMYVIGIGDRLEFDKGNPEAQLKQSCDFPYFQNKSRGDQTASTKKLLDLLCASVSRKVTGDACLMLSSGKDSVAIALAMKECGLRNVQSFTYSDKSNKEADEGSYAAEVARKLGFPHKNLHISDDRATVKKAIRHFFTHSPYPSCDPTTIPYAVCLYQEDVRNMQIVNGSGNDIYMGHVPSAKIQAVYNYYRIIRNFRQPEILRKIIPFYHKLNKFFTNAAEFSLYGHGHLRNREINRFFPTDIDFHKFWAGAANDCRHMNGVDFRAFIRGKFCDSHGIAIKESTIADSLDSEYVLPWADKDIIDYYFHLPAKDKFDLKGRRNKMLLRDMLKEHMSYDADTIGKKIFFFGGQKFILNNTELIKEEILQCKLWKKTIEKELDQYLNLLANHPRVAGSIIDLFMTSGWHNHCKYIQ